jgi:hypothetical protein
MQVILSGMPDMEKFFRFSCGKCCSAPSNYVSIALNNSEPLRKFTVVQASSNAIAGRPEEN